jgi:Flp pilus assembly CpaF family ATPase
MIRKPHGILLVTGPTGSGKSTSLYAWLHTINSVDKRILTVEDPIEYEMAGINQIQMRPDIGLTFAVGLRHILRQDPDVIMVGEIRDKETAEIAVQAALTGHLVFSTLHTNSAVGAIARLRDMGVEIHSDDFGSGRASIVGLLKVQPDRLKIECRMIRAALRDPRKSKVVAAILEMTRALGIAATAEGVESARDIAAVRSIGCVYYQGKLLAPPLQEAAFIAFLSRHQMAAKTKTAGRDSLPFCL